MKTGCYKNIIDEVASARPGVLELMDAAIADPRLKVMMCVLCIVCVYVHCVSVYVHCVCVVCVCCVVFVCVCVCVSQRMRRGEVYVAMEEERRGG